MYVYIYIFFVVVVVVFFVLFFCFLESEFATITGTDVQEPDYGTFFMAMLFNSMTIKVTIGTISLQIPMK